MFNNLVLRLKSRRRLDGRLLLSVLLPALFWAFLAPIHAAPPPETKLQPGGQIVVTDSIALADLISHWGDGFADRNPSVSITITELAMQAFLDYARSTTGQAVAMKAGYVPLPTDLKGRP